MELSEDLLHRMMDYKIMHIHDLKCIMTKLRENWQITLARKPLLIDRMKDKA